MWIDLSYFKRRPFYMTELQEKIAALPEAEKQEIKLLLSMNRRGQYRRLSFAFPRGGLLREYFALLKRYLLAMINNMVVSFGGAVLELYFDASDKDLLLMMQEAAAEFDLDREDNYRTGYGVYVNYINRMNTFLDMGKFRICFKDAASWKEPDPGLEFRVCETRSEKRALELLRRAASEMEGKRFCSLDVGGNSIKGAVVSGGDIRITKEYQWYPAGLKTAEEMNSPQLLMLRFLSDYTAAAESGVDLDSGPVRDALNRNASYNAVLAAAEHLEGMGISPYKRFDAIVIGFPDIVVNNKIAGGESFKHRGMKMNAAIEYEKEFFKTSELDNMARVYAKEGAPVIVLNDTNTASYLISVEQSSLEETMLDENGVFINTIGTEMGTGIISRGGTIHYIPMECYQHVIDLGNTGYEQYPLNDVRSTRNMNTGIPGTVQKNVTQMGLFRMAVSAFAENDQKMLDALLEQKLIRYDRDRDSIEVVTEPIDSRDKLTRLLTDKMLAEKNPVMEGIIRAMGKGMGVLIDQGRLVFPEIKPQRLVSGGIMASDLVFQLFRDALRKHNPGYDVIRLDEQTVHNPLLKKIKPEQRTFTVAIGSVFIGNRFLLDPREA
jgi:predicted NBD/HSP70 family sugar kinase